MTPTPDEVRAALHAAITAVAPEVDLGAVRPDRPLRQQVELDSYDFLCVVTELHGRLGVDVPEADYAEFATLDGAVAYLVRRLGGS